MMFPPEVGLRDAYSTPRTDDVAGRRLLAPLKTDGVVGDDMVLPVATGNGWDEALETAEWKDGDLLALGTTSRRS